MTGGLTTRMTSSRHSLSVGRIKRHFLYQGKKLAAGAKGKSLIFLFIKERRGGGGASSAEEALLLKSSNLFKARPLEGIVSPRREYSDKTIILYLSVFIKYRHNTRSYLS